MLALRPYKKPEIYSKIGNGMFSYLFDFASVSKYKLILNFFLLQRVLKTVKEQTSERY